MFWLYLLAILLASCILGYFYYSFLHKHHIAPDDLEKAAFEDDEDTDEYTDEDTDTPDDPPLRCYCCGATITSKDKLCPRCGKQN